MSNLLLISATALLMGACALPFGLGRPSTSQLENGAADSLAKATSFEAKGSFTEAAQYKFDTEYVAPSTEDIQITQGTLAYELLQVNGKVYIKGGEYLLSVVGNGPVALAIEKYVGTGWFTTTTATPVDLSAITDANKVKANFLNTIADKRTDDVMVNGQKTAELTLSDSILNITEDSPYRLVRLRSVAGKTVQGVSDFDMTFTNYNKDFGIQAPAKAFDFDDPTSWPPMYQVDSVSQTVAPGTTNSCDDPCQLSAVIENIGGTTGATSPSTVTFVLTSVANSSTLGSCKVAIQPDRIHAQKFSVSCKIQSSAWTNFSGDYNYNASVDNPAYD